MNSIYGIIIALFTSITASIGNSLVIESMEKNYQDLEKFTFLSMWMITVCVCCFSVLYQPFMKLWVGEKFLLDYSFVILFCIYFFVLVLAMVWATVKDAAGLWRKDRFRPLIGAVVNLALNLTFVRYIGLYGIILSTIVSYLFVSMPWLIHNLFHYLYKRRMKFYVKRLGLYTLVCALSCIITIELCHWISVTGFIALLIYGIIAVVVSCGIQLLVYHKFPEFKSSKKLIEKMMKRGNFTNGKIM